jgi:HSP20 family protein
MSKVGKSATTSKKRGASKNLQSADPEIILPVTKPIDNENQNKRLRPSFMRDIRTDIHDDPKNYYIECELPGITKENIHVEISNTTPYYLNIKATMNYLYDENVAIIDQQIIRTGTMTKRLLLPDNLDITSDKTSLVNGMLKLEFAKVNIFFFYKIIF